MTDITDIHFLTDKTGLSYSVIVNESRTEHHRCYPDNRLSIAADPRDIDNNVIIKVCSDNPNWLSTKVWSSQVTEKTREEARQYIEDNNWWDE